METSPGNKFRRHLAVFIGFWCLWASFLLLDGLVAWLIDGKDAFFRKLSFPLDWISPAFAITSKTSFGAGCEIFLINTLVTASVLLPVSMFFLAMYRRSRPIQLRIDGRDGDEEGDESSEFGRR